MKIRTLAKQIEKMKEVAGCDETYGIIDGVVHYIYYIHFKDEEIPAMPLIIMQRKPSIILDMKRYFFIRKEVKNQWKKKFKN